MEYLEHLPTILLGFVVLVLTIFGIITKTKQNKRLREFGIDIMADIVDVIEEDEGNGKFEYDVMLSWTDENGQEWSFKIDDYKFDPRPYLPASNKIKVRIDPDNPKIHDISRRQISKKV